MTVSDNPIERYQRLAAFLQTGGLMPCDTDHSAISAALASGGDLIPAMLVLWQDAGSARRSTGASNVVQWLEVQQRHGGRLTLGSSVLPQATENRWLGARLAWWPAGIPAARRIGLASSRIGRELESYQAWFALLRAACSKIDRQRDILLTATETTAAPYVQRAAELFGVRLLTVQAPQRENLTLANWFRRSCLESPDGMAADQHRVVLSPNLVAEPMNGADPELAAAAPARDRALVAMSEQLLVFHVRRRGQLMKLLQRRLSDEAWPLGSLYVALGEKLVDPETGAVLMDRGAVGWVVTHKSLPADSASSVLSAEPDAETGAVPLSPGTGTTSDGGSTSHNGPVSHEGATSHEGDTSHDETGPRDGAMSDEEPAHGDDLEQNCKSAVARDRQRETRIVALPPAESWDFLTHCTRRQDGPWPDQSQGDYLADVILQRPDADHSAFAALWRIVEQRKLLATGEGIRGASSVVSFTAAPLAKLPNLRVFRPHRGRWDFEPYGICVRLGWLRQQGARSVQYGNDALWESLPDVDRPFFQVHASSGDAASREIIDWSVEQEWRHAGTLDLQQLPPRDGLVFVPSVDEARQLAEVSRWPVTVLARSKA